jgi:hypothetical protein
MLKVKEAKNNIFYFIFIPVFVSIVFIPGFTNYLLADDWIVIHRNMNLTFSEIYKLFTSTNYGWYRPVFEIFIFLCSLVFNFQAIGYHIVILFLYLIVLFMVGKISLLLTRDAEIGFLSAFLFGILSIHSEPVFWISASNEILTAFFALSSFYYYLLFRNSVRRILTYFLSIIFMAAALFTKETSSFYPLLIPLIEYYFFKENNKLIRYNLLPVIPFLLIQLFYLIFRITAGFPYEISFSSLKVAYVLFYYLFVIVFSMPDNFGYLSSAALWKTEPLFPIIIILFSIISLGGLVWLFIKHSNVKYLSKYSRFIKLSIGSIFISLLPVLPLASGRTAFLMTIGYSWLFSIFIYTLFNSIKFSTKKIKLIFAVCSLLLIFINIGVVQYRGHFWRLAGYTVNNVTHQLNSIIKSIPDGEEIYIFGLPDHINRAYTFRNAISTINQIYYPNHNLRVWLDTETDTIMKKKYTGKNVFIYKNGDLIIPK